MYHLINTYMGARKDERFETRKASNDGHLAQKEYQSA